MLVFDKVTKQAAVVKKGGHASEDVNPDTLWQRKQPSHEDQWITGLSTKLLPTDAPCTPVELHDHARNWSSKPGNNGFTKAFVAICRQSRLASLPNSFRSVLTCGSCFDQENCSWTGVITYDTKSHQLTIKFFGNHSEGAQIQKRGFATDHQKHLMAESKAKGVGKIVSVCNLADPFPQDHQVMRWCARERKKSGAGDQEEAPKEWPVALIDAMLLKAGIKEFEESCGENDAVLLDKIAWEEDGKERCAYVIGSKATLRIFQLLVNKSYIKIGADATFKKTFDGWCLIPIGPITKRYAKTRPPGTTSPVSAWASHMTTAVWVLASGELGRAYGLGFKVLGVHVPRLVPEIDMKRHVKQVHTDMAASAEMARKEHFDESIGVKDFYHVLVKISETLESCLETHLAGDKKIYSEIVGWVHRSRCHCITLTEIHNLWQVLRKHYTDMGGKTKKAMDLLFERYFVPISVDTARRVYKCENMTMLSEGMVMMPLFWCGLVRLEPGSGSGSQCVEASHGGELGPNLQAEDGTPLVKATPDKLFPAMSRLVCTLSRKYSSIKSLPNLPESYDPKLMSGAHLAREGRSTAAELFRKRDGFAHKVQVTGWGDAVVMPRSLWKYLPGNAQRAGQWVSFRRAELELSVSEASEIAKMALEFDGQRLFRMWQQSGVTTGGRSRATIKVDPEKWTQLRHKYVVVLWGQAARKLWAQSTPGMPDCLCNCTPFMLWAGCEHQHCARAMMDDTFKLTTPGRNKGGRGCTNVVHHGVRSTCASKLRGAAARRAKQCKPVAPPRAEPNLHKADAWCYQLTPLTDKKDEATPQRGERRTASSVSASHQRTSLCIHCSSPLQPGAKFCAQCGTPVSTCVACQEMLPSGAKFCSSCGTEVPQSAASSASGLSRGRKPASSSRSGSASPAASSASSVKKRKLPSRSSSASSVDRTTQTAASRAGGHRIIGDISGKSSQSWKIRYTG